MRLRNFTWQDLPLYARLIQEATTVDGARRPFTVQDADEYLHQPNLNPERDCFIAEVGGSPAGHTLVVPELQIQRAIIEGMVHPAFRRKGIGHQLLRRAIHQAQTLGARVAHVSCTPAQRGAQRLLARAGFQEVHRQWQMRLAWKDLHAGAPAHGYEVRHLAEGEEPLLTELQNQAFAGSWGFAPNTPEEVSYRLRMGGGRPEDALLLMVQGQPAAYCWTKAEVLGGELVGIIWMIGVHPQFLRRGLGRATLLESIGYLRGKETQSVELTVYADNIAAVELYKAVGFQSRGDSIWYERPLEETPGKSVPEPPSL